MSVKADRAGTGNCPRQWPCRYVDARQCAHDRMFGSECPKICDCEVCHGEQRTMPNERILDMNERVRRIEAGAIMSPTEASLLDLVKSLINEIQMLDAELSILSAGEGPTGCADDQEYELSDALKALGKDGLNKLLAETLNR